MGAGGKVLVAAPAAAALGDHDALVRLLKVVHQLARLRIVERCAHRNLQRDRAAIQPGAVRAHAVLAALRLVLRVIAEVNQRVVPLARLHDHVAAAAAVAARGPPARHELLAPEGHAAVAAVAGLHANLGFIDKHGVAGVRGQRSETRIRRPVLHRHGRTDTPSLQCIETCRLPTGRDTAPQMPARSASTPSPRGKNIDL